MCARFPHDDVVDVAPFAIAYHLIILVGTNSTLVVIYICMYQCTCYSINMVLISSFRCAVLLCVPVLFNTGGIYMYRLVKGWDII